MLKFPYLSYVQGRHIPSCPFPVITFVFFFLITLGSLRHFFLLFFSPLLLYINKNNNTNIISWVDRGSRDEQDPWDSHERQKKNLDAYVQFLTKLIVGRIWHRPIQDYLHRRDQIKSTNQTKNKIKTTTDEIKLSSLRYWSRLAMAM